MKSHLAGSLASLEKEGLFKKERVIVSVQDAAIRLDDGSEVLNFCSNNYLGLSSHPRVVDAAKRAIDERGFGMSSVRFICGTQDIHKELERAIADFHNAFLAEYASVRPQQVNLDGKSAPPVSTTAP